MHKSKSDKNVHLHWVCFNFFPHVCSTRWKIISRLVSLMWTPPLLSASKQSAPPPAPNTPFSKDKLPDTHNKTHSKHKCLNTSVSTFQFYLLARRPRGLAAERGVDQSEPPPIPPPILLRKSAPCPRRSQGGRGAEAGREEMKKRWENPEVSSSSPFIVVVCLVSLFMWVPLSLHAPAGLPPDLFRSVCFPSYLKNEEQDW